MAPPQRESTLCNYNSVIIVTAGTPKTQGRSGFLRDFWRIFAVLAQNRVKIGSIKGSKPIFDSSNMSNITSLRGLLASATVQQ